MLALRADGRAHGIALLAEAHDAAVAGDLPYEAATTALALAAAGDASRSVDATEVLRRLGVIDPERVTPR